MLYLQLQTTPFGAFTTIDIAALGLCRFKLSLGYSHPTMLSLTCYAPQHTFPLGIRNFIRFWDDAGSINGTVQSATNPLFEGFVDEVKPGTETNVVHMTAYDPTRKAAAEVTIMSLPYVAGDNTTVPLTPPAEGTGSIPRTVYNSLIDNDDDYAYERLHFGTMGQIFGDLMDMLYHPLYWANAAPGDGTSAGNDVAYLSSDLAALTFVPQEKMVFESEGLRSALDRMLHMWEPAWRMLWYPGSRRWRFSNITGCPQYTFTLNSFTGPYKVLSLELDRSLEGRATAVKIYGPPNIVNTTVKASDGSLTIVGSGVVLESGIGGGGGSSVTGYNKFQITNASQRNMSRLLQNAIDAQYSDNYYQSTKSATFFGYWPMTSAGGAGWRAIDGWFLDAKTGTIFWPPDPVTGQQMAVFRYNPAPAAGQPHYEVPTDYMLTYGRFDVPLTARYPTTGYAGSAYDVANLANELKLYDEQLAVNYEYGTPVTTVTRLAQFTALAQRIHAQRSPLVYLGGCVLHGLVYDFARINARINFAAVDGNGASLTTGWEAINALVTDVEYDFAEQTTTLTFSSDQLELIGVDVDALKKRLVSAVLPYDWTNVRISTTIENRGIGEQAQGGLSQMWNVHKTNISIETFHGYQDQRTGRIEGTA